MKEFIFKNGYWYKIFKNVPRRPCFRKQCLKTSKIKLILISVTIYYIFPKLEAS